MAHFFQYFTAAFYLLYILIVFVWPSIRTYRQTGINPFAFGNADTAHNFIGKWFKILLAAMALTLVLSLISVEVYHYLLPAHFLVHPGLQWTGILLCISSLIWTAIAQRQMGDAWRIGIDEQNKTALQTRGLFSVSRNPIFLGLLTALLGFFLLLPNAFTLLYLVAGYLLIQVIIRLEEDFLLKQHGIHYRQYKEQVPRIL